MAQTGTPPLSTAPARSNEPAGRAPRRWLAWVVYLFVFASAFAIRLIPVLRGGGLSGFYNYDPAVYYASSVGFAHGLLPYRDFLTLHPPGLVVALLPFALIGESFGDMRGMELARLAVMVMGSTTAVLVSHLVRRAGLAAMLVGGLFYAVYWPAVYTERSTWLEGFGSFLTVAAMVLVLSGRGESKRSWLRWAFVGACLGLACTVKIWAVVLLAPVLIWLWVRRGWKPALQATAGSAVAGLAVAAPFLGAIPQMWEMVVLDQLGRHRGASDTTLMRLEGLTGLNRVWSGHVTLEGWVAMAVILVCLVVALWSATGRFAVLLVACGVALLLTAPTWFRHYPTFVAGPLAVAAGAAAGVAMVWLRPRWLKVAAASVLLALLVAVGAEHLSARVGTKFKGSQLAALAAKHPGCVATDDPNALIASNLLGANIGRGCPYVIDLSGYRYHLGGHESFLKNSDWQAFVRQYLGGGSLVIVLRGTSKARWDDETTALVESWPVIAKVSGRTVRQPG